MNANRFIAGLASLVLMLSANALPAAENDWVAVSWHDVRDDVAGQLDYDRFALSTAKLAEQFDWIERNGWQPVSVEQILAARRGEAMLPDKAVLLTFDDGLESLYTRVFPLLRAYRYPAVAAIATGWLDSEGPVDYEGRSLTREQFVGWDELRSMVRSGLVELATHSHDLHHGVVGNPWGNRQPAATTLRWDPESERYETVAEWRDRIRADLAASIERIERHVGVRPRVIAWPYGEYNEPAVAIARELGLELSLGLTIGLNNAASEATAHRLVLSANPGLGRFIHELPQPDLRGTRRAAQVDMDYLHDPDPEKQARNLDALIQRIHDLGITSVWLQAFADPDGDGAADALYFPNRHLPMRADLFNRVAWQLRTRAGVEVFAWMPVLAFETGDPEWNRARAVRVEGHGPLAPHSPHYRLSPFLPENRRWIGDLYEDLARHAHFAGLLFHDDAWLGPDEDQTACLDKASWPGSDAPLIECRLTPDQRADALTDFTDELAARARVWAPALRTARNLFAPVLLDPADKQRFAQDYAQFLERYDYTAVMAMPRLEGIDEPRAWLQALAERVRACGDAAGRTVFELQARDWTGGRWVDGDELAADMHALIREGILNLAWYPDDFTENRPEFEALFRGVSHRTFPYRTLPEVRR